MGTPWRENKEQLLMQGQFRWGLSILQVPQCVEHLTKNGWLELTSAAPRPSPQEQQKVAELPKREAPGLLGAGRYQAQQAQSSAWADTASALGRAWAKGPLHALRDGLPTPATSTRCARQGVPRPHAVGHREGLSPREHTTGPGQAKKTGSWL